MFAILKDKPEPGVVYKEVPDPKPRSGELLIRVLYGSICGTDIGIYDWIPWAQEHMHPPSIIGHEVVGEVLEINGNPGEFNLKVGDLVSSETHIFDGTCSQCVMGNKHICENMHFFGYERDGGFADYATIPIRTTWKNDSRIPLKAMSVQEPLGNSVHAVTKAQVKGKKVLIMGLGPTGLCAAAVANAYGAKRVVAIDPREYRTKLAKKFTNVETFDSYNPEMDGSFDVVLEMSGAQKAITAAFEAVRLGGKIIAFGIPKSKIELDWGRYLINKELSVDSIFGRRIWETWHQTSELLTSGKIDILPIITHEFPLAHFEEAMEVMKSGLSGKVVLKIAAD